MLNILFELKDKGISITEMRHAYRLNGVVDIWKSGTKIFIIPSNEYKDFTTPKMAIDFILCILPNLSITDPYKKTPTGRMSYKEFKNNSKFGNVKSDNYSENYQWKINIEKESSQHLYFILTSSSIKIGKSINPVKRIKELSTGMSEKGRLFIVNNKGFMEPILHNCFKEFRLSGEWFKVTNRITSFIRYTNAQELSIK